MSKLSIDFESLDKGTPLDALAIAAVSRVQLARYAGAADDFNPMHLDDKVAMAAGKTSVFAPLGLVMGFIGRLVEMNFANASVRRFGVRMLKLVWPGDVLTCRGVVIDKREDDGDFVIDADVWAENQRGETVAKGPVMVVVPAQKGKKLSKGQLSIGLVYPPNPKKRPAPMELTPTSSKSKQKK